MARGAQQLGYASLCSFSRLLVPEAARLPAVYASVFDPVVPLAAAATERVRLGTAVVNMPFPFERRGARAEEYLVWLRALQGPDPVGFAGEFYRVPRSRVLPKPVRRPHPPLLLGGGAPAALARIGRLADGWISASRFDPTRLGEYVEPVRQAARDAGRDPAGLRFVCRRVLPGGERTGPLTGPLEEVRADLPALAAQGVTEVFVDLNFDPAVGNPDVEPEVVMARDREVLGALAPG